MDLHGEADAGAQKAAAARATTKAAVKTFMSPEGGRCGRSACCPASSAGILCSSGRLFIGRQAAEEVSPAPYRGVSETAAVHWLISSVKLHKKEKKT